MNPSNSTFVEAIQNDPVSDIIGRLSSQDLGRVIYNAIRLFVSQYANGVFDCALFYALTKDIAPKDLRVAFDYLSNEQIKGARTRGQKLQVILAQSIEGDLIRQWIRLRCHNVSNTEIYRCSIGKKKLYEAYLDEGCLVVYRSLLTAEHMTLKLAR